MPEPVVIDPKNPEDVRAAVARAKARARASTLRVPQAKRQAISSNVSATQVRAMIPKRIQEE